MSCSGDIGTGAANTGMNIGLGFMNFFGLGGLAQNLGYQTPYDKLKDKLNDIQQKTADFRNQANVALFKDILKIESDQLALTQLSNSELVAMENLIKETLEEEINLNTIYIAFCFFFFICIFIYTILKKKK